jgi:OOP family OmpA-OmpF porin
MQQSSFRAVNKPSLKVLAAAVMCAGVFASNAAQAQNISWYVAGDVGQSNYKTNADDVGILGGSFDRKDTQSGFALGAQLNKTFAVELGYSDFGKVKISGNGSPPCNNGTVCVPALFPISGDAQAKATHLSLVSSVPLMDNLSLYGRLGTSRTDRSASVRVNNLTVNGSEKKTEAIYGIGLAYAVTPNVDATIEWKKLNNTDVDAVSAGIRFRF